MGDDRKYKKDGLSESLKDGVTMFVPFAKFIPLISDIGNLFNEIIELEEAAEHNKRTCEMLKNRVSAAVAAVRELREKRKERKDFFNSKNYIRLQELSSIITRIKNFISEISQMKSLIRYFKAKNTEKLFKELCEEFDSCIGLLSFTIELKIVDELGQLKSDQDEFAKYLEEMVAGMKIELKDVKKEVKVNFKELSKQFSSTIVKVNAMNTTMEKFMGKTTQDQADQAKIDNIFQVHPLKLSDYDRDDKEKPRKNGRVTKWYNVRNKAEEFALKTISEKEDQRIVQNQVTILKELHDWQNIIKFYGIISDGNKWYLVTEWAEYGNLREFYQNKNDLFNLRLKLRISLDIARGLSFLRTVEIVHRDIRAENILITINETAKLANFKLSRYLTSATLNQSQTLERVRYCAPELLERAPNYKYDQRCEVYSFGILLWEIAEESIPYQNSSDIVEITEKVHNKMYREPFSENSQMPEEFKQLEIEAVDQDPDFRPKITKVFEVLNDCFKKYSQVSSSSSSSILGKKSGSSTMQRRSPKRADSIDEYALPDFESFKYMTLTEAAKQHNIRDKHGKTAGDLKNAYKCFDAYANLGTTSTSNCNRIKAKYYKAYYITKGYVESPPGKDKVVAELFKEVADDGAKEFSEAKVRYGDCLYNGRGVEKNEREALKYFEKAAEDGLKVAMYNAGNMYYNGIGCEKNIEKAKKYMKLAAYSNYEPAIKFCKERDL